MSACVNEGGRAFACGYHPEGNSADQQGMTLRDYFAAKAMQGMLANNSIDIKANDIVHDAYYLADAMIKERSK